MLRSYKVAQLHFFPLLVLYDGMSFLRFSFCRWNIIFPARQKETHQVPRFILNNLHLLQTSLLKDLKLRVRHSYEILKVTTIFLIIVVL